MTPACHTPGLASPELDTGVGISLLPRLKNHNEAGTVIAVALGNTHGVPDTVKAKLAVTNNTFVHSLLILN